MSGTTCSSEEESTNIFKLDNDCLSLTFDYIPLQDLASFAKTCKNLKKVAGEYFRDNYFERARGQYGEIHAENFEARIDCFSQYIRRILLLEDGDLSIFQANHFQILTEIEINEGNLRNIESVKNILPKIETLKFINCEFDGDVDETFLSNCGNLKRLYVRDNSIRCNDQHSQRDIFIGNSNKWLTNRYPTLEHFEVNSRRKMNEVIEFLIRNSNIRRFSTRIEFLIENEDAIAASGIHLDVLAILHENTEINETMFSTFTTQLLKLQKRGFFKQLHLYFCRAAREYIYPPNLMPAVKIMHGIFKTPFPVSGYVSLQELYLYYLTQIIDLEATLNQLTKLNYVYFVQEQIDHILPFIKRLPNLRKIKVDSVLYGLHFNHNNNVLNISAVNDEREKCPNAKQLTIYVNEQIFLATKMAFNQTAFNLIEIKRIESFDGVHDFHAISSSIV